MSLHIRLLRTGRLRIGGLGKDRGGFGQRFGCMRDFLHHLAKVLDTGIHRVGQNAHLITALEFDAATQVAVSQFFDCLGAYHDWFADRAPDEHRSAKHENNGTGRYDPCDFHYALKQVLLVNAHKDMPIGVRIS